MSQLVLISARTLTFPRRFGVKKQCYFFKSKRNCEIIISKKLSSSENPQIDSSDRSLLISADVVVKIFFLQ